MGKNPVSERQSMQKAKINGTFLFFIVSLQTIGEIFDTQQSLKVVVETASASNNMWWGL